MAHRVTIRVDRLRRDVNKMLAESTCPAQIRQGSMNVLEQTLHLTDNYRGFRYLSVNQVPAGQLPGINVNEDGSVISDYEQRFLNTDPTRVEYF